MWFQKGGKKKTFIFDSVKNNITFSIESTKVDVTVYPIKQIPFVYEIDEEKYPDVIITAKNISRENIMVVGRADNLAKIDSIVLDTSSLDITPEQSSYELSYILKDLLPEGVMVYGEDKTVSIKVETDAIITKTFEVPVNDIAIKSLGDGLSAAHETTGMLTYTLKGRKSILDVFVVEDNPLFVSTKNLGIGTYNLDVVMDLDDDLELVTPIQVQVKISEKEKPTETTTPESSSSQVIPGVSTSTQQNQSTQSTQSSTPVDATVSTTETTTTSPETTTEDTRETSQSTETETTEDAAVDGGAQ